MADDIMTAKSVAPSQTKLAARLAAAQAKLAAAQALMTDEDRADAKAREEIAKVEEQERDAVAEKRADDLAKRLEACIDKVGNPALVRGLIVKGFPDFFIVRRNGAAHARWEKSMGDALQNARLDQSEIKLKYALASVEEWNGKSLDDTVTTRDFNTFLEANPGVITSIVGEAIELNGAVKEARKSTG